MLAFLARHTCRKVCTKPYTHKKWCDQITSMHASTHPPPPPPLPQAHTQARNLCLPFFPVLLLAPTVCKLKPTSTTIFGIISATKGVFLASLPCHTSSWAVCQAKTMVMIRKILGPTHLKLGRTHN